MPHASSKTLEELRSVIARETSAAPHLAAICEHNRVVLRNLDAAFPLRGAALLDLGGSSHGYALEAALELGVQRYEGVNLAVGPFTDVAGSEGATGRMSAMDAARLEFPDNTFDAAVSISTFEHFLRPGQVLAELHRVLRPGAAALVSFEPVWTSARGHHLHHFGLAESLPPWAHLLLNEAQLAEVLARHPWPENALASRAEVVQWVCQGDDINRLPLETLRAEFEDSPFEIEWLEPLRDADARHRALADYVSTLVPWQAEDLLTRGLSILLRKPEAPAQGVQLRFGAGFHPCELVPGGALRWAGTLCTLRLRASTAGPHRLNLGCVTPFFDGAQQVEVAYENGRVAGRLEFSGSDVERPQQCALDLDLVAGRNVLRLVACRGARFLSPADRRVAAFGLVTPD